MHDDPNKIELIKKFEGYSLIALGVIIACYALVVGGLFFGVIFGRAFLLYLFAFTIGPYIFLLALILYIASKLIGWLQEVKPGIAIFVLILVISVFFFLYLSGTLEKGANFLNEFNNASFNEKASVVIPCPPSTTKCKGVCYTNCSAGQTFTCDESAGGICNQ